VLAAVCQQTRWRHPICHVAAHVRLVHFARVPLSTPIQVVVARCVGRSATHLLPATPFWMVRSASLHAPYGYIIPKDGILMLRRDWLTMLAVTGLGFVFPGCRGTQYARVIKPGEKEMVGSHQAGQETFRPLVDEAVTKLVARHAMPPH